MMSHTSETTMRGLPPRIRAAQAAIQFPEVQEMLRRLAEYDLGVCMPHMHDELTGNFATLPAGIVQVESGLKVSFDSSDKAAMQTERFLPVGWAWRGGKSVPVAACEMVRIADAGGPDDIKHKM